MADDDVVVITDNELLALKREVLAENIDEISNQLGDPGRYFATFKAKNLLDQSDCEHIKGQTTSIEKAMRFIDLIRERDGRNGEHSYDVLVNALKRMKVHIHIVRILNQALAKKRSELKIKKSNAYINFIIVMKITFAKHLVYHECVTLFNSSPLLLTILIWCFIQEIS
jgi:hypothetical protein